jgi:preprotein translocase subunit SecF
MEFFRIKKSIPFMRYALFFNVISLITFFIAVGSLATKGLHLGVDFTGGTVIEVSYEKAPDLDPIRESMIKLGFSEPGVQNFGTAGHVCKISKGRGAMQCALELRNILFSWIIQ